MNTREEDHWAYEFDASPGGCAKVDGHAVTLAVLVRDPLPDAAYLYKAVDPFLQLVQREVVDVGGVSVERNRCHSGLGPIGEHEYRDNR